MIAKNILKKILSLFIDQDVRYLLIYLLLFSKEESCSYHILFQQVYNHPR